MGARGALVLVVGPSGAGKDTLMDGARARLAGNARFVFPRRLVTRAVSPHEEHDTIDADAFEAGEAAGAFALSWRAHGLGYAIPREAVRLAAEAGRVVVVNGSRSRVEDARARLPGVVVVEITAPRDLLAARILARGRDADAEARLARSDALAPTEADVTIVNDGSVEEGVERLVAALTAVGGPPASA